MYNLSIDAQIIPVYCHMGDFGCGGGGWTLALKTDGLKVRESLVFAALLTDVIKSSWFFEMERDNMHLELCCDFTFRTGKQAKLKCNSFLYTVIVNLIFYPICDLGVF